jgi:hypothetical protein
MPTRYLDEKITLIADRWRPLSHQGANSGAINLVEATLWQLHEIRDAAQAVVDEIDRWPGTWRRTEGPCI